MAFLCPIRVKKAKKKKPLDDESLQGPVPSMGRITGSASIETLVRVGIEKENGLGPESKMVVLHDFTPCVDDELEVKRGQVVHVLYQENDWVYVISAEDNQEGFIPHSYCTQYGSQLAALALNVKKKLPRDQEQQQRGQTEAAGKGAPLNSAGGAVQSGATSGPGPGGGQGKEGASSSGKSSSAGGSGASSQLKINASKSGGDSSDNSGPRVPGHSEPSRSNSMMSDSSSQPDVHPFYKEPTGRYIVLYNYTAQDENDLTVERGQCVTVLNTDDSDWYWVSCFNGREGFVPAGFIYPLDAIERQQGLQLQHRNTVQHRPVNNYSNFIPGQAHFPGGPGTVQGNSFQYFTTQPQLHQPHQPMSVPLGSVNNSSHPHTTLPNPNNFNRALINNHHPHQTHHNHPVQQPWGTGSAGSSGPPSFNNNNTQAYFPPTSSTTSKGPLSSYQPIVGSHNIVGVSNGGLAGDLMHLSSGGSSSGAPHFITTSSAASPQKPTPLSSTSTGVGTVSPNSGSTGGAPVSGDMSTYNGTELIMLYDYKAQAPDDLTVKRGDWVYADLNNQTVDGWLWSYAPKTRKYGFIPKAYARPPAMTSL